MLKGKFDNCYGIKKLDLMPIDFDRCNKAIIYAPNGVMKTSFSSVFSDIAKGCPTKDRIFQSRCSRYQVEYRGNRYNYSSNHENSEMVGNNNIYVIQSFEDQFVFTKDTVNSLLADEETRGAYNGVISQFSAEIKEFIDNLRKLTGLTGPQVRNKLEEDFGLPSGDTDWTDIFQKLSESMEGYIEYPFLEKIKYSELFNDKVMAVYCKPAFQRYISRYIDSLEELLSESAVLTNHFTDRSIESLSKAFANNNLFEAEHSLRLRDGTIINSLQEWKDMVSEEVQRLYQNPDLRGVFENLKKILTANKDVELIREFIVEHRELIPLLRDVPDFKRQVWLYCIRHLENPTFEELNEKIVRYRDQVRMIYDRANQQSQRWEEAVTEFNRRFRVPFKVQINNKANFLLKDEAPNLSFLYSQGEGEERQEADLVQEDLMNTLSMGEKRALYLMYVLFDLEEVRNRCADGNEHCLVIADDIADSFDYKNKYAIIEYLQDLSKVSGIDLLVLTHNFDFYRTVATRIGVNGNNTFLVEKKETGDLCMKRLAYRADYFKGTIISQIRRGNFDTDQKKKFLIAGIPFYRNLNDYKVNETESHYMELTCLLHYKTEPVDTSAVSISDVWYMIHDYFNNAEFRGADESYFDAVVRIADSIVAEGTEAVCLENKLVVSIACRLKLEKFLKQKIVENEGACEDSSKNQTRDWSEKAAPYLSKRENGIVEEVNLITPESIHLNAFMYEPLIDISDWTLKQLYRDISSLQGSDVIPE